jgi:hypothetical protein
MLYLLLLIAETIGEFVIADCLFGIVVNLFTIPPRQNAQTGEPQGYVWNFWLGVMGASLGGLSTWIVPHLLLGTGSMRFINLGLSPLAAAGLSWRIAAWRKSRGAKTHPSGYAVSAFWFVLAFAAVRLVVAER